MTIKTTQADRELIFQIAQNDSECRKILAAKSQRYYSKYYLGRDLWPCQQRWSQELEKTNRGGIIGPPGHGKTELVSRDKIGRLIAFNRNIRIIMISLDDDLAKDNGAVLRQDLENPRLVADFGPFKPKLTGGEHRPPWEKTRFTVRRDKILKDPTFRAAGIDTAVTGGRCDCLIFEDIIDEKSVRNPRIRKELIDYIDGTLVTRLEPWGVLWLVGTRKHKFDIYDWFLKNREYRVVVTKALIREPENYEFFERKEPEVDDDGRYVYFGCKIGKGDPGKALNPVRWSVDKLLVRRKSNPLAFNREYQAEVVDDETALIKKRFLEAAKDENLSYGHYDRNSYIQIITGGDPSLVTKKEDAEARDTDYTAILTIGILPNYHFDLLGIYHDRGLTPKQVENAFINEARLHRPNMGFIETNSFGTIIHWNLADKNKTGVPWGKHLTGSKGHRKYDPYEGYPTLAIDFENGLWRLPYKTDEDKRKTDALITELYNPEDSGHDDKLSGLWIARSGARRWMDVQQDIKKLRRNKESSDKQQSGVRLFDGHSRK